MRDRGKSNNNRWSVGPLDDQDYNNVYKLIVRNNTNNAESENISSSTTRKSSVNIAPSKPSRKDISSSHLNKINGLQSAETSSTVSQSSEKTFSVVSQNSHQSQYNGGHYHPTGEQSKENQKRERSTTRRNGQVNRSSSRVSSASSMVRWPFQKVKNMGSNMSLGVTKKGEKI